MYLTLAGNIGAGKSSLTRAISEHFGIKAAYEQVETNPYLEDFYLDMHKWAFHVQVHFLNSRFAQLRKVVQEQQPIIQDRSIYEDAHIFAKNQWQSGWLSDRDHTCYQELFGNMVGFVPPPKLLIYLRADLDFLRARIALRGRSYERDIPHEYLQKLNLLYEEFVAQYDKSPVVTVEAAQFDFLNDRQDHQKLMALLEREFRKQAVI